MTLPTARGRVAVVTATIPLTVASFRIELIRQLQAAGYLVWVVSSPGDALTRLERELGVRAAVIPMSREVAPLADALALTAWLRVCRRIRPRLIVSSTPKASLLAMLAGRATGVPQRLYHVGGLRLEGDTGRRRALLARMERITGAAATHIVGNSASLIAQAQQLGLFPADRLFRTDPGSSHGVDSDHFAPRPPDPDLRAALGLDPSRPVVGFIGRLTHDKGIDTLLGALDILCERGVDLQLLIVGAQIEPDSQHYARLLAGRGGCVLAGAQQDVRPYLALMDVHVLPSLREGFPNVVLEAAAMGVATVTTDATGCVDSVTDGVTGLVVPTRSAAALAEAIGRLLANPGERARLAAAARDLVTSAFQPDRVVASLLAPVLDPAEAFPVAPPPAPASSPASSPAPGGTGSADLVTVTAYGPAGASARVRVFDWLDHLGLAAERHCYRAAANNRPGAMVRDLAGTVRAERAVRGLRVRGRTLLVSREASPWSTGSLEERLLREADHGVYDFDDALFADASRAKAALGLTGSWRRAVAAADTVIAGNDYLGEHAAPHNRDVRVIPSCIEPADYRTKASWTLADPPRLVWLGSPTTEAYLLAIAPALREVHRTTGARLTVISAPDDNRALASLAQIIDRVAWRQDDFAEALARADVAIGPLEDTPWTRGKCAYKLLQYAATGLPMVATPVGANEPALRRFGGLAASTHDDWVQALRAIIEEPADARQARGQTARRAVAEHYSFTTWAPAWRSALGV